MEKRQIIVLSKSSKYQDYCVAGIDIYTGEWIRPITNNTVKENGIPKNAFVDNLTKKSIELLDVIEVNLERKDTNTLQPENYILANFEFQYIGTKSLDDVNEIIVKTQRPYEHLLGYDDSRFIPVYEDIIDFVEKNDNRSLLFVNAFNIRIYNDINYRNETKTYADFTTYSNNRFLTHKRWAITDETQKLNPEDKNEYFLKKACLVVSRAEYPVDTVNSLAYYKNIASIFVHKQEDKKYYKVIEKIESFSEDLEYLNNKALPNQKMIKIQGESGNEYIASNMSSKYSKSPFGSFLLINLDTKSHFTFIYQKIKGISFVEIAIKHPYMKELEFYQEEATKPIYNDPLRDKIPF